MAFKNIVVQVDTKSGSKARLEAAVDTAKRFNATLTGMLLKAAALPKAIAEELGAETAKLVADERAKAAMKNSKEAKAAFQAATAGMAGAQWLEFDADHDDPIINCTRFFDLSIFPAVAGVEASRNIIWAEQIAMGSGGPVLVLPVGGYQPRLGSKVMIAWKDTRESARMLRDAWPFITQASEVHFVLAGRDAPDKLDPQLEIHLKAHGVSNWKVHVNRADDAPLGEVIRRHIDMIGADMVMLGLYGHARIQEYVFGGVSRNLLTELHQPLFVSH
jgi:nucleotide-binding universal stress UspA family protein